MYVQKLYNSPSGQKIATRSSTPTTIGTSRQTLSWERTDVKVFAFLLATLVCWVAGSVVDYVIAVLQKPQAGRGRIPQPRRPSFWRRWL
jgi:hypothetical protein